MLLIALPSRVPSLHWFFDLYRFQSIDSLNFDWLAASGSDCQLVQILGLHLTSMNGCDALCLLPKSPNRFLLLF
jgi:hypothetical protein